MYEGGFRSGHPGSAEVFAHLEHCVTVNFNVMLDSSQMSATVGDLKNAFCQSQPLHRPKGTLDFQQPKERVVGPNRS